MQRSLLERMLESINKNRLLFCSVAFNCFAQTFTYLSVNHQSGLSILNRKIPGEDVQKNAECL